MGEGSRPPHHTLPGSARPGRCPHVGAPRRGQDRWDEGAVGVSFGRTIAVVCGVWSPKATDPTAWAMSPPAHHAPFSLVNPD